jgi:AcrR family transcriptional regulator
VIPKGTGSRMRRCRNRPSWDATKGAKDLVPPSSPRERLIETGRRLFYKSGFHATGIDTLLAEAGVAKKTLYTHFRSKEDLILAVMRRRDQEYRDWIVREVNKRSQKPAKRLLACFDVIGEWVSSKDFYGCACINASAEFADKEDPVHTAAADHKRFMTAYLRGLARDAKLTDPTRVARQLLILIDGAVVVAQVTGRADAVRDAKRVAELLIAKAAAKPIRRQRETRRKPAMINA